MYGVLPSDALSSKATVETQELTGFRAILTASTWCLMGDGEKRAIIFKIGGKK